MVTETQIKNAINKNAAAAGNDNNAGAGTGFESKQDKIDKDADMARVEAQADANVVDAQNASEPVKILNADVTEAQREENGILSTKRTQDTITIGNKISAIDANQDAQMQLMQCTLQEIADNIQKWEVKARQAQDYAAEAKFISIANALGAVVNNVRTISANDLSYTCK